MKLINRPEKKVEVDFMLKTRYMRIHTIDFMKGLSMIMIFYCHLSWVWRAMDWFSLMRFEWFILDFFGPIMFVMMSVVGNMISFKKRQMRGDNAILTRKSFLKVSYLLILGEVINFTAGNYMGAYHFVIWNVITTIAVFSLLTPYLMLISRQIRVLAILIITLLYFPLVDHLTGGLVDANIYPGNVLPTYFGDPRILLYFLFFDHRMMTPIFSWLLVPLLCTIIFEPIVNNFFKKNKKELNNKLNHLGVIGVVFIAFAVILGSQLTKGYINNDYQELIYPGTFFNWPFKEGYPIFLVRHTPQYIYYNFGIVIVLFFIFGKIQVIKGIRIPLEEKINNFGALSLSAFMLSHVGFVIEGIRLTHFVFLAIFIPLIIIIVNLFWYWSVEKKKVGTLEWLMGVYVRQMENLLFHPETMGIRKDNKVSKNDSL
ncbi:MAG: heparan-alpha-glucosaminide N-acetyltransferase domain-containing protein [Promethearchaeota archaeon]